MFYLTPQEKRVVLSLCVIVFCGTLVQIGLQKNLRVFDWLHSSQKSSLATAININRANVDVLLRVPGIGPKTADYIMAYRHTQGLFSDLEPLRQAKGMSPQRYDRIIKYLKI